MSNTEVKKLLKNQVQRSFKLRIQLYPVLWSEAKRFEWIVLKARRTLKFSSRFQIELWRSVNRKDFALPFWMHDSRWVFPYLESSGRVPQPLFFPELKPVQASQLLMSTAIPLSVVRYDALRSENQEYRRTKYQWTAQRMSELRHEFWTNGTFSDETKSVSIKQINLADISSRNMELCSMGLSSRGLSITWKTDIPKRITEGQGKNIMRQAKQSLKDGTH